MKKRFSKKSGMAFTLITVVVLFVIISYQRNVQATKLQTLNEEKVRCEQRISELEEEEKAIEEYREYVKSDEYIEDVAREKLGLVYPGDVVFEPDDD